MDAPSKVVQAGGETDRLEALSEIGDAGSESDQMDELLDALLKMARLIIWKPVCNKNVGRICEQCGAFEMLKISSQGRVLAYQAFLRGHVVGVFLEFWKMVGYGAKVAPCPSD